MRALFRHPVWVLLSNLLVVAALLAGCGGSDQTFVANQGSGNANAPAPTTGSIEVRSVLARTVPSAVTQMVFSGFDASGDLVYGPVVFAKAAVIRLDNVPTSVVTLRIVYLESTVARYIASLPVSVEVGETTVVQDPDFEDVEDAVTAIEVVPGQASLAVGEEQQLVARGTFSDGETAEISSLVNWSSQSMGVASVSNQGADKGLVSAVSVGQTTVTATLGQLQGQATISVSQAAPVQLRLLPANGGAPTTAVGATLPLRAELVKTDGQVTNVTSLSDWTSSAPSIASVGATTGVVTGQDGGTAQIEAEHEGLTATLDLTVTAESVLSIEVTPGTSLLHQGLGKPFKATGTFSDGSEIDLTEAADWSSDDDGVATVTGQGFVRAVGDSGETTTLEATFQGVTGQANVRIGAYLYGAAGSGGIVRQPLADGGGFTGSQTTFQSGTTYQELVMDPTGQALFALTSTQTLESFRINPVNGDLTLVDSAACAITVAAVIDPTSLMITPDGSLIYATSRGATTVAGVMVDTETLELTSLGAVFTSGGGLEGACLDSTGRFLFALRLNELLRFSVNSQTGALLPLSPSVTASLASPAFLQASDTGLLYAINRGNDRLLVFSVDTVGELRALSGSPYLLPSTFVATAMLRVLVLKDGTVIYGLRNADGLVQVGLSADSGVPESSSITTPPPPTSVGITQTQGSDFVYTQAQDGGMGPTFRSLRKGVTGVVQVLSPLARSVAVTP